MISKVVVQVYKVIQRFYIEEFCIKPNAFIKTSRIVNCGYVQDWNEEGGLGNWIVQRILEAFMVVPNPFSRCAQETHVRIDVN
jgi:hypothetical protein